MVTVKSSMYVQIGGWLNSRRIFWDSSLWFSKLDHRVHLQSKQIRHCAICDNTHLQNFAIQILLTLSRFSMAEINVVIQDEVYNR